MTRQKKLQLSGIITAPLCKGSSAAGGEGLFFFTTLQPLRGFQTPLGEACKRAAHTRKSLQPLRGFRTPLGDACKHASHTRKSNPSRRGLQACSAYLQIPCVKGAPPQAVTDCCPLLTHRSRGFPLSHKRGLIKINPRSDSFLFDLLSYLLSQKTRLGGGFFHQSINPNGKSSEREETL